ncbi:LD-carboxypeptidase [Psychrobacter aestuarii]|uniref:LD-carboxypeptidase n=1 Tax=Psychrobacter aestuarii TaxID=556327 RepID=A0ABN0VNG7_9GAMM|nr:LD-carboxypeptidase [Psychrobacter aestuarii]
MSQSNANTPANPTNRRQFLGALGACLGVGALGSAGVGVRRSYANADMLAATCHHPTIETRLFASSNASEQTARNALALARIRCAGFDVKNPEIVSRQYLRFAGTDAQRAADLQNIATGAIAAPKVLLGVRGGYGAMRILPNVDWQTLGQLMRERGTILAGFSDVTAIQCALLAKGGMSSLAAPMLYSEFGKTQPDIVSSQEFVSVLTDKALTIDVPALAADSALDTLPRIMAKDSSQSITGTLWGGNLSVVSALAGSAYLPRIDGGIVFLEDVGEQSYRVERMLYDLYLAGAFKGQQAIVFGALSGTGEDSYDKRYDARAVIEQLRDLTGLPIYTGMPFGHVGKKRSFPLGALCRIQPDTAGGYQLSFSGYPTLDAEQIYPPALWQKG